MSEGKAQLHTPDGRYIIVRGHLWRATNPHLSSDERARLVTDLMDARRAVKTARANSDPEAEAAVHRAVNAAKNGVGERGPVWWNDGAPDLNRRSVKNTNYDEWYSTRAKE